MEFHPLPFNSTPKQYQQQAEESDLTPNALAQVYGFADWDALVEFAIALNEDDSAVLRFESAVEAVIAGDLASLEVLLREHPDLARARSTRMTRATLLHYVAANGVENIRQRTPASAVAVARMLLEAGAEVDATASMYGGPQTTMNMLVSSAHPAKAGVQVQLVETLLDFGADIELGSPLTTALAHGYADAAKALVKRGARVETLAAAAGLGRVEEAARFLPGSAPDVRHRALALAAQHGHAEIVRMLIEAGEDPSRYNPKGNHGHSTPLHQAALAGHDAVVRLLVERGARLDVKDTVYSGTPRDWAIHAGRLDIANYLI